MKRKYFAFLVAALVTVSSMALTTSASARPDGSVESVSAGSPTGADDAADEVTLASGFMIQSGLNATQCLDIRGGNTGNGASVAMWRCTGAPSQRWFFSDGFLRSDLNGRCLDVADANPANGAAINMWDCNQRWVWDGRALLNGGRCLDIAGWNSRNGAALQMWDCHGGANQSWILVP